MTEDIDAKIANLTKRVDDQSRFTRTVVVVCAAAVMGVQAWALSQTVDAVPAITVARVIEAMAAKWTGEKAAQPAPAPAPAK